MPTPAVLAACSRARETQAAALGGTPIHQAVAPALALEAFTRMVESVLSVIDALQASCADRVPLSLSLYPPWSLKADRPGGGTRCSFPPFSA